MLRTSLCDLLGIELPIISAPMGPKETLAKSPANCHQDGVTRTEPRPQPRPLGTSKLSP